MKFGQNKNEESAVDGVRAQASLARRVLLCLGALLPAVLLWGCSGLVKGQNTAPPPPPPQTYNISGTIAPAVGGNGATVAVSGAANATTTANSSGNFTVTGLANGTYTITPSRAGFSFTPSSLQVTINGANVTTGLNFTATAVSLGISGTITPTAGGSGATVTLSGAASATTTTDGAGNYTFTGLQNGSYTVTPSHTGYTFTPGTHAVTVSGASVTGINFTATAQVGQTFSVSGTISPTAGGGGATVTLSGAATAMATADGAGRYTFSGLSNGTYAVTPSHTGYTFNPSIQAATVSGANVTGINFTATVQVGQTFSISGTISPTTGGSGAAVALSGASVAATTTDGAGIYTFSGLSNGTYTVTPTNAGFAFTPASQSVTIINANVAGVNFTASVPVTHTVALSWVASNTATVTGYNVYRSTVSGTGYAKVNSSPLSVLIYTDAAVMNATTYYYVTTAVDASGVESNYSNEATAVIP
jgi:hypothetical protein